MNAGSPRPVVRLERVDSTNTHLARLLKDGAAPDTVVVAAEQTGGRGQLGRVWHSPPGSLALSLAVSAPDSASLPFAAAVASAEAVRGCSGLPAMVRWPNDIIIRGCKAGGVLVEGRAGGPWVIGFGINVNAASFPDELARTATSLAIESGQSFDLALIEQSLLRKWDEVSRLIPALDRVLARWRLLDCTPGSRVRVREGETERAVEAAGVDDDGRLLAHNGQVFEIISCASALEWVPPGQ